MAKKASKKAAKKSASKREILIVASKVKDMIKGNDCNTAGDALEGLSSYVGWLIDQACKRAVANGRKTVRPHDFVIE